jgi:1-acyl-sn-glycerol-3-phosphate acyltransferase
MSLSQRFIVTLFRLLTSSVFRIHDEDLSNVPLHGPLIIVTNHINILEIPLIYAHLQPRPVHGLVLADRWKNPVIAWGLDACGAIPLERGSGNLESIHRSLEVLNKREMLLIMPEGTRSGDGRLQEAQPGVALLALKSRAPLLPIVFNGGENYKHNIVKLQRTDFFITVGKPFCLDPHGKAVNGAVRKQMADEIMYQLAAILPPQNRGCYTDLSQATDQYLLFTSTDLYTPH